MTNTNAAESRIALALGVVDRAFHALRAARAEIVRLDAERERELDAALDAAMADENVARADQLADEAQRHDDAQGRPGGRVVGGRGGNRHAANRRPRAAAP
jgi:hypothetical protein